MTVEYTNVRRLGSIFVYSLFHTFWVSVVYNLHVIELSIIQ